MALILDQTFASDPGGSFATLRQSAGTLVASYQADAQAYNLSNATLAHNIWDISSVALQSTGECEIDIELIADQGAGTTNASLWMVNGSNPAFSNGFRFHHNQFTWNLESWTGGTIWAGNSAISSITNTANSAAYNKVNNAGDPNYASVSLLLYGNGLNATTTFTDSSPTPKTVTVVGGAQISTTQSRYGGSSMYFNNSSYLSIATNASLTFNTDDYTVECWVRFDSVSTFRRLISSTIDGFLSSTFCLRLNSSNSFYAFSGGAAGVTSSVTAVINTWYHVAVTRQAGTMRLFVDGVLQGSEFSSNSTTESIRYIGGYYQLSSNEYHNGYIDDLRITKGVARYIANFTPATTELQNFTPADPFHAQVSLILHGDGTNGSTSFVDSSPITKTVTAFGNAQISTTQSKYDGSSMYFDGTGDYLQVANNNDFSFGSGNFTVEMWVYQAAGAPLYQAILGFANSGVANVNYAYQFIITDTGQFWPSIFQGSTQYGTLGTAGLVTVGQWTHVAVVRNGDSLLSFVNGLLDKTTDVTGVTINNPAGSLLQMGLVQGSYPFVGYMDDVRITKGAARYTANFTPSPIKIPGDRRVLNMRWDSTGGIAAGKATMELRIDDKLVMSHFGAISAMRPGIGIRQSTCRVHSIKVWDAPQVAMIQIANKETASIELGRRTAPFATTPNKESFISELGIIRGPLTGNMTSETTLNFVAKLNIDYSGNGTINGSVKIKGSPDYGVSRKVQLYHNNKLLQEVWSDANGDYEFNSLDKSELYNVVVFDHTSTYKAIISDGVTAV